MVLLINLSAHYLQLQDWKSFECGVGQVIRALISRAGLRAEEVSIWLYSRPQETVCQLELELAPTGLYVQPVRFSTAA